MLRLQSKVLSGNWERGFPIGPRISILSFLVYIFIKVSTSIDCILEPLLNAKESGGNFWVRKQSDEAGEVLVES